MLAGWAAKATGQPIRARVLPTPDFVITAQTIDGKTVLFVEISPGATPPYGVISHRDQRDRPQYYVRRGASTYPAQPSDLHEVFQRVAESSQPGAFPPRGYIS
jgi:predicted HTH transcriptional regulator